MGSSTALSYQLSQLPVGVSQDWVCWQASLKSWSFLKTGAWMDQNGQRFLTKQEILAETNLTREQGRELHKRFPVRVPREYFLLSKEDRGEAIKKMALPSIREGLWADQGLEDPVGEQGRMPLPGLIRKHADRVVVLITGLCHFYCRVFFSRGQQPQGPLDEDAWQRILSWLRREEGIREVIFSGGDPLTLPDEALISKCHQVRNLRPGLRVRIHSRSLVTYPERISARLLHGLAAFPGLVWITHVNHPLEFSPSVAKAMEALQSAGVVLGNQAVLLSGVNDEVPTQLQLWRQVFRHGLFPHYLHHPDAARGNAHFCLSLEQGRGLWLQVLEQLEVPAPLYVVDPPQGCGKVPVLELLPQGSTWVIQLPEGGTLHLKEMPGPP
jgi:lysine 2,3-aminomutase